MTRFVLRRLSILALTGALCSISIAADEVPEKPLANRDHLLSGQRRQADSCTSGTKLGESGAVGDRDANLGQAIAFMRRRRYRLTLPWNRQQKSSRPLPAQGARHSRLQLIAGIVFLVAVPGVVVSQPAEFEIPGLHNFECVPTFMSTRDRLVLYRRPTIESDSFEIPYRKEWEVPAPRSEGMTRILSAGLLRVIEPDDELRCEVEPENGPEGLVAGEVVQFLYRTVEGWGVIRVRGGQCHARVSPGFGLFEGLEEPEIQEWLRFFYADGTSPGWLLNDRTQVALSSCSG